jgi:hypothetical protein
MSDTYSCGCGSTSAITIPCCPSTPGATGATGPNGGVILFNDYNKTSTISSTGAPAYFSPSKTYSLPLTQITNGDRLKIESYYELATTDAANVFVGAGVYFNTNAIGGFVLIASSLATSFVKVITIIDVVGDTGDANNINIYSTAEYCKGNPFGVVQTLDPKIVYTNTYTIPYGTGATKEICALGVIGAGPINATTYCKCTQLCIEYLKKI